MGEFIKKIFHLPGTKLTPEVVLHRTLEKLPRMKAVAVVIIWDDESVAVDWSQMKASQFAHSAFVYNETVRKTMTGET